MENAEEDFVKLQFDLKGKQDEVQKKTFMKWINSVLSWACFNFWFIMKQLLDPPTEVSDISDLSDGIILLNLLKALTGETVPIERGDRFGHQQRIHHINNVGKALQFLQDKQVKMVNIHASDIVDGKTSIVLGLIWTLILHFQIEESTKHLCRKIFGENEKLSGWRECPEPKMVMLKWAQKAITEKYGIEVKDFGPSWRNGVAFNALIHEVNPLAVDMKVVQSSTPRENLERAFDTAEHLLRIPRLLDPEDVDIDKPDERSIMTYISKFVQKFPLNLPNFESGETGAAIDKLSRKVKNLDDWLRKATEDIYDKDGFLLKINDVLISLQEFSSKLEDQMYLCHYLASEVEKLSNRVPHNVLVVSLKEQTDNLLEALKQANELKDMRIREAQELISLIERHEDDMKMFEKWREDGYKFMRKLDETIRDEETDVSRDDLYKWKGYLADDYVGKILRSYLETLEGMILLKSADHEQLKEKIVECLTTYEDIRKASNLKLDMVEFKMEEGNSISLLDTIFAHLSEVERYIKSEGFCHEKALAMLEDASDLVSKCGETLDAMTSISGKAEDEVLQPLVQMHSLRLQQLSSRLSEMANKLSKGAKMYNDYLERKFDIIAWIDRVEMYAYQLKDSNLEFDEFETALNDFRELMDEIGYQKKNICDSKVLLQELAFNSVWSRRIDDETFTLCDLVQRLNNLCQTSEEVMRTSTVIIECERLKSSIRKKMEEVRGSCFLAVEEGCHDDVRGIKMMLEEFEVEKFESSITEVEILMEEGYSSMQQVGACRYLGSFLRESFQFCCDSRDSAHKNLATLKKILELWQMHENLTDRIREFCSVLLDTTEKNQVMRIEELQADLTQLETIILELSRHISKQKQAQLFEDFKEFKAMEKEAEAALRGKMKDEEMRIQFDHGVSDLQKFFDEWKVGLSVETLSSEIHLENVHELSERTQVLVEDLKKEGSSKIIFVGGLLGEISNSNSFSKEVKDECFKMFEALNDSFREFCAEIEDLQKCVTLDVKHLIECGKMILEISDGLQSETFTLENFQSAEEVEIELNKVEELHSKLNYYKKLLKDLESSASLVSKRNSINSLVYSLKDDFERYAKNLDARYKTLTFINDQWNLLEEIEHEINSVDQAVLHEIDTCKSLLDECDPSIMDGSLLDKLDGMMFDICKNMEAHDRMKSVVAEFMPRYVSNECHENMKLDLVSIRHDNQDLAGQVNSLMELTREAKEYIIGFPANVNECLREIDAFDHVLQLTSLQDLIIDESLYLSLKEKFEKISHSWVTIEKKKMKLCAYSHLLEDDFQKIDVQYTKFTDVMNHMNQLHSMYCEYKAQKSELEVQLMKGEQNLFNDADLVLCQSPKEFKGVHQLLEKGRKMEELIKSEFSKLGNLLGKSLECSFESCSEFIILNEKFDSIRMVHKEFHALEKMLEKVENLVHGKIEILHKEISDVPESLIRLQVILDVTEINEKQILEEIKEYMTELDDVAVPMMEKKYFNEKYGKRYQRMRELVRETHEELELEWTKRKTFFEKLTPHAALISKSEVFFSFEVEKLVAFDELDSKVASLQNFQSMINEHIQLLMTSIEDVDAISKADYCKLLSGCLSNVSSELCLNLEQCNALEKIVINEIKNMAILKKCYEQFWGQIASYNLEVDDIMVKVSNMLSNFSYTNEGNLSMIQESLHGFKVKADSIVSDWKTLMAPHGQRVDIALSEQKKLLKKISSAQETIDLILLRADQSEERLNEIKYQTMVMREEMRHIKSSLSFIDENIPAKGCNSDQEGELLKIKGWMKCTEEYLEELEVLQSKASVLSEDFEDLDVTSVSSDLVSLREEMGTLKHKLIQAQEKKVLKKKFELFERNFEEFLTNVDHQLESIKEQKLFDPNGIVQLLDALILEGDGRIEEIPDLQNLDSPSCSEDLQPFHCWQSKKEQLKILRDDYEEMFTRSKSLNNRLIDFSLWLEEMKEQSRHLTKDDGHPTNLQRFKEFEDCLKKRETFVEDLSKLLGSMSCFEGSLDLVTKGDELMIQYFELKDSTNVQVCKAKERLDKILNFKNDEKRANDLMVNVGCKISQMENLAKLDDKLSALVDIDEDLEAVKALVEKMEVDQKSLFNNDPTETIQSCTETLRKELGQIVELKVKAEDEVTNNLRLFDDCQADMKALRDWIGDKESWLLSLKQDHFGMYQLASMNIKAFENEMSLKMRYIEKILEKIEPIRCDELEVIATKCSDELKALRTTFLELQTFLRDQTILEEEYFDTLELLKKCFEEMLDAFERGNLEGIDHLEHFQVINFPKSFHDFTTRLKTCLTKTKSILEASIESASTTEMDAVKKHQCAESKQLLQCLEQWIFFQNAAENYCCCLKMLMEDETDNSNDTTKFHEILERLHFSVASEEHQKYLDLLRTAGENMQDISITMSSFREVNLWNDISKSARLLFLCWMEWTSKLEEISTSWKEYSSLRSEVVRLLANSKHMDGLSREDESPVFSQEDGYISLERKVEAMMDAAFRGFSFLGLGRLKVEWELDATDMKKMFQKTMINTHPIQSKVTNEINGLLGVDEKDTIEKTELSLAWHCTLSPDDAHKMSSLCHGSFRKVLRHFNGSRSDGSSTDESLSNTEENGGTSIDEEVSEGLNELSELLESTKIPFEHSIPSCHPFATLHSASLSLNYKELDVAKSAADVSQANVVEGGTSSDLNLSPLIIPCDSSSVSSCYSNFLQFMSSCMESFSLQPKKFYQQLEDVKYSYELTRNLEYFNIVLPMGIVLKLKKIADWTDPAFKKFRFEEGGFISQLSHMVKMAISRKSLKVIKKDNLVIQNSDLILLHRQLEKQRKEFELALKKQKDYISAVEKINGKFQDLYKTLSEIPPDSTSNDHIQDNHLDQMKKSIEKSRKDLESVRNSPTMCNRREGLSDKLFKLLGIKIDEMSCEVGCRRRHVEARLESRKRMRRDLEAFEFKMANHNKWLIETEKLEFDMENEGIFKCIEHELKSRLRDVSKMMAMIELMIEDFRWRQAHSSLKLDEKMICSHVDIDNELLKLESKFSSSVEDSSCADDASRIHLIMENLYNGMCTFRKRLRDSKMAMNSKDVKDSCLLRDFEQLEDAWKEENTEGHFNYSEELGIIQNGRDKSMQYNEILEHLAVLKLSINCYDLSKRKISSSNVNAFIKKFLTIKRKLMDIVPSIKGFALSDLHTTSQISDLKCVWEILCGKFLDQVQALKLFIIQMNRMKREIEKFKNYLSLMESDIADVEIHLSLPSCLNRYEEIELAANELEKSVSALEGECQKILEQHESYWNFQYMYADILDLHLRIKRFLSRLDSDKSEIMSRMEIWTSFMKGSGQTYSDLYALECSLHVTCNQCQVEDGINLLENEFKHKLKEIDNKIKDLQSIGEQFFSTDDEMKLFVVHKTSLLLEFSDACKSKGSTRLKKLLHVSEAILRFGRTLSDFKRWMSAKELELSSPFKFSCCGFNEITRIMELLKDSQKEVEFQSTSYSCLVGVCEVLSLDLDSCPSPLEQKAVVATKSFLENKWNNIVDLTLNKKLKLEEVWSSWKKYFSNCEALRDLIESIKSEMREHQNCENFENIDISRMRDASLFYKGLILRMEGQCHKRDELKECYREMALSLQVDEAGEMQRMLEEIWNDWQEVDHHIRLVGRRIGYHLDLFKMFQSSAVSLHEWLVGISNTLEQIEKSFEDNPGFNCKKNFRLIKKMKREVRQKLEDFTAVAKSLDVVIEKSDDCDSNTVLKDDGMQSDGARELLENFSRFQSEVLMRIKVLERKMNHIISENVDSDSNEGSNVDEMEHLSTVSSHLNKTTDDSCTLDMGDSRSWTDEVSSVFHTQMLLFLLITAACLFPVSKIRASDLMRFLTRH